MTIREQQQAVSAGLGSALAIVALLPSTASLELKWVGLALAASLLCVFKAVILLSSNADSQLLRRRRTFEWIVGAYLAVMLLTAFLSPWPDAGWLDIEQTIPALIIALFAHNLEPDATGRRWLVTLMVAVASLVSIYALLQIAGLEFVEEYSLSGLRHRAMASFGNPTFLAGWLAAIWPFCLLAWLRAWKASAILSGLLILAAMISTQTRSGLVAVSTQVVCLVAALVWMRSSNKIRAQRLMLILGIFGLVALSAALVFPMETWLRPTQRLALWSASLELFSQKLAIGFGPGSYVLAMQENLPELLRQSLETSHQFAEHPHNWILVYLCEGGLLYATTALFLILYSLNGPLAILKLGRKEQRDLHEAEIWSLVLGLSLIGLLAQNMFDRNLKLAGSSMLFWALLGWMAPQDAPKTTRIVDVGTQRIAGVLLMLSAFLVGWAAIKPVTDYRKLSSADNFVGQKVDEANDAEKSINKYLFEHPDDPDAWEKYGESLARQEKFREATQAYLQALRLRPDSMTAVMNLGNCYFLTNKWDNAKKQFERAIQLDPNHADAHFNLGYVYYYKNKMNLAVRSLNRALKIDKNHAGARKLKKVILTQ